MSQTHNVRHLLCNPFHSFFFRWGSIALVLLIGLVSWSFTNANNHSSSDCENTTNGGTIGTSAILCDGANDPGLLVSITEASGGTGELEYLWLSATSDCPDDLTEAIPGATQASYAPGPLATTTYFRRCARRSGCNVWSTESNCIRITINEDCIECDDELEPPVLVGVPSDTQAECDNIPAVPTVTATDNCTDNPEVILTQERENGDCPGDAVLTRTWTAFDDSGNETTGIQVITINDTEPPKMFGVPNSVDVSCGEIPPIVIVTAIDNCTDEADLNVTFTEERIDGDCDNNFTLRRIWQVADECGNVSEEVQVITVSDNQGPTLENVPSNLTVDPTAGETVPLPATVTANDNCDNNSNVTFDESSEMDGCMTIITRTWTSTDLCNNESSGSQIITVLCDESCDVDAGSLTPNPEMYCLLGANVSVNALHSVDPVIPPGFSLLYLLSTGSDLVIRDGNVTPNFVITLPDNYTIHTLIFDPNTLDLGVIDIGTTTGFDINELLIQGGGDICGGLDVTGAPIVVTQDCGCQNPVIENVVIRNSTCGNSTGSITIEMVGSESDFTYSWSSIPGNLNGIGNQQTDVPGGAYQVTITDLEDSSCETIREIIVNNDNESLTTTVLSTPATCQLPNGTANIIPTDFNYTWLFDGLTTPVRSDLPAGTYSVMVEDPTQPGCVNFIEVSVTSIEGFEATVSVDEEPNCGENTGTATISIVDGSGNFTFLWSDGISLNGPFRNDLPAGSYSVTITDNESGCIDELLFSINNEDIAGAEIVINTDISPDCPTAFDGTIDFEVTPETGFAFPVRTEIRNSNNLPVANGMLGLGEYCLLVFDVNNCLAASNCFEISQPEPLNVQISVVDASCDGGGAINLETSGGDGNYNFDWADIPGNNNPSSRSDLNGGAFSLTVTDGLGCTAVVDNILVAEPTDCFECEIPVVTNIVVIEATCDNSDGIATIDLNVNPADYSFTWTPNVSNTNTATGIPTGNYQVVISDLESGTCTTTVEFAVGTSDGPEADLIHITPANCLAEDGTVTFEPTDFTYTFSDGVVSSERDDLPAGEYFVTITDPQTNCDNVIMITVPQENNLNIEAIVNQQPTCGNNNGSVTLLVTGGSGNFAFSWGPDETEDDLAAGIFSVTIVDTESGCQGDIMFVLDDQLSTATISLVNQTIQLDCAGDTNGMADFTVNPDVDFNGIPEVVIVDQSGNEVINGELASGDYCIMVFDANSCLVTQSCFEVIGQDGLDVDIQIDDETCDLSGSILVTTTGGNPPFVYDWADLPGDDNGPSRLDLDGGTFSLTVTDASGCTAVSDNIIVEGATNCDVCEPIEVTSIVVVEATCNNNDGTATIEINQNPDEYTFNWTPNVSNGSVANNLSAGTFEVEIINIENADCSTVATFAVGNTNGPEPTSIDIVPSTCLAPDGEVTFLPTDFTYTWSDNLVTNSRADLPAGTYFVTVNDLTTNCLDVITVIVPSENLLEATHVVNQNPNCGQNDGSVTINVTGGSGNYGYSWGGGPTRTDLASGIYNVTISDPETGCFIDILFALEDDVIGGEINLEDNIVTIPCAGDANGRVEFNLVLDPDFAGVPIISIVDEDGNEQVNGELNVGEYCLLITDSNECLAEQSCFEVIGNELIDIDVSSFDETCTTGGSINLVTTGGVPPFTYDWFDLPGSDNPMNRVDLNPDSYGVVVTDSEGCNVLVNNISIFDTCMPIDDCVTPVVENTVKIAANCDQSNGSAFLELVGDNAEFSYSWTPNVSNTASANNIPAGAYTVLISRLDDPTCQTTTSFVIQNSDGPQPEIISTTPATCNELNGTGVLGPVNFQYEWCNGTTGFSINNLPAGSCFVTVTDFSTGCLNFIEVIIDEFNPLEVTVDIEELPSCNGNDGVVSIDVANGSTSYTYDWSDGGGGMTRNNLVAGSYTVTVTDNGSTGCEIVTSFVLLNEVDAAATITIDENPILLNCIGSLDGMVDFTVDTEPGFVEPFASAIFAENGMEVINGELGPGEYCIVVTDANGCVAGQSCFSVEEPTAIILDIITENQTCDTTGMIFVEASGGNGGYIYDWQDLPGIMNPANRTDLTVGAFTLTVTDQNGCTAVANNLPIIDECIDCPSADTVNVNLPVNSMTEYCFELEPCFDSIGISYELLGGGFAGLSNFGSWTLGADGCLDYTSNGIPGIGVDTVCIIANDNGLLDTTCIIFSITTDCQISSGDTLLIPTFDCDAGAEFCLPIGSLEIDNFQVSDNGVIFEGGFIGCDSDTSIIYRFDDFLIDFPVGPYELIEWPANGNTLSVDTFLTIADLFASVTAFDPTGNWELEGNDIITREINGVYGAMTLRSFASTALRIIPGEINIFNNGSLMTLDTGFHQIITFDLIEGCVDTFNVDVDCRNCPGIYDGPTDLVAESCDGTAPVCVDLLITSIVNLQITDNGAMYDGGFLGCNIDSLIQYDATNLFGMNLFSVDEWTVQGTVFSIDDLTSPQELVDSMNVIFPLGNWRLDGFLIIGDIFNSDIGSIIISVAGTPIEDLQPGLQPVPNGLELAIDTGFHQIIIEDLVVGCVDTCLLYTSPSPRDATLSRMPSSA